MTDKQDVEKQYEFGSAEKPIGIDSSPDVGPQDGLRTVDAGLAIEQVTTDIDQAEERRIIRKIDFRLIPLLSVLYLWVFSFAVSPL